MSSLTVSVPVIPAVMTAPLAAAAGAGIAGLGLAAGAYLAAKKLTADYNCALEEFHAREKAAANARATWNAQTEVALERAISLADLVGANAASNPAADFLQASLIEAVKLSDRPEMMDLNAKAAELLRQAQAGAGIEELSDEAIRIGNEIHKRMSSEALKEARAPMLSQLLASVEVEIAAIGDEPKRTALQKQLAKLESLPSSELAVALQGLTNIREQASRLMQTEAKRVSEREQRREIAADTVALLQAILQIPEAQEKAGAMAALTELASLFSGERTPSLETLENLRGKARKLFDTCQARLENAARAALITDSVADTLMEMGYKVSHVPAEGSDGCMISVSEETGMLVSVDQTGQLKTEMVAFSERAVHPSKALQDRVCSLVDDVLEGLRKRDIGVNEKSRKTHKSHEKIRVVKKPQEAKATAEETKLKERALK